MAKSRSSRPSRRFPADRHAYWNVSKRPLQILTFLLPLILLYELSLVMLLRSEHGVLTNNAHKTLLKFFAAFGVAPSSGFYLGGIAVVVVLLVWHVLNRDEWTVDYRAAGLMALESLALTLPLLVLGQLITRLLAVSWLVADTGGAGTAASLGDLGVLSKFAISVGAGLYEELMFRMLLIAIVHTLLVDVGKATHQMGAIIAVFVSAAAFTAYHPLFTATGSLSAQKMAFYFVAGLYFGAVYVMRGFGIVVAVHALYDIITFSLLSSPPATS